MGKFDKLIDYILLAKDEGILFFNPKNDDVILFNENANKTELETIVVHNLSNKEVHQMSLDEFELNYDKYIPLRIPKDKDIMKAYAEERDIAELKECLKKKGAFKNFKRILKEKDLTKDYHGFEETMYKILIDLWVDHNDLLKAKINKKEKNALIDVSMKISKLKPWKYFSDLDTITIKFDDDQYSYLVLGNCGECTGICVYEGDEGLNQLKLEMMLANIDEESLLSSAIKNSYAVYYDKYDDLCEPEKEFLDGSIKQIEDIIYPNFHVFSIGEEYKFIETSNQARRLNFALNIFHSFLKKYLKNPKKYKSPFDLNVNITEDGINIKRTNNDIPALPYFNTSILEEENNFKKSNKIYMLDLTICPIPVVHENHKYIPFIPIIYDVTSEKILYSQPIIVDDKDYIKHVYMALRDYFNTTRAPKTMLVNNPITHLIATILLGIDSVEGVEQLSLAIKDFKDGLLDELYMKDFPDSYVS